MRFRLSAICAIMVATTLSPTSKAEWVTGIGWGQINRHLEISNLWEHVRNTHYEGYNRALSWPGAWGTYSDHDQRRSYANYRGYVVGARNVHDPQYPDVVWPYMVAQRDGRYDGIQGEDFLEAPPSPTKLEDNPTVQTMYKGRLVRRTYRQAQPTVTVDGVESVWYDYHTAETVPRMTPEIVGDEADASYQIDVIDPTIPCDLMFESQPWTRMGIASARTIYVFVDRDNDDSMFWHWSLINNGLWSRIGVNRVDGAPGGVHATIEDAMLSLAVQWDRSSRGAHATGSAGEANNDSIWRYYGTDYDGARTEDMRMVWVVDGDQDVSKFDAYSNGSTDDSGDPDPVTGELLSAKAGGLLILHCDSSTTNRRDDPAQPMTVGWTNYRQLLQTGPDGHEAKYNQMRYGYQKGGGYYAGSHQTTPGRGTHPFGGSWIKASNDPAVSSQYWPGKVLGVDIEVTDVEQQMAFGPKSIPPNDTLNLVWVYGVNGVDINTCQTEGAKWLRGDATDEQKNALVESGADSLFATMRQAKAVYESATFPDGFGQERYASARTELEDAFRAAIDDGILTLSPPAPASFTVNSGAGRGELEWTLDVSTGSDIAGWRVYRAHGNYKGDSLFVLAAELPPDSLSYHDYDVIGQEPYYYYLTTFDAEGHESTMHTRTAEPMVATRPVAAGMIAAPLRFDLAQNAPNPFNPRTVIRFGVPDAGSVRLAVCDVNGRHVRMLVDAPMQAGHRTVAWDGRDALEREVSSGVYLYRLTSDEGTLVRKMLLVR